MAIIVGGDGISETLRGSKSHVIHLSYSQQSIIRSLLLSIPSCLWNQVTDCWLVVPSSSGNFLDVAHHLPWSASMYHQSNTGVVIPTAEGRGRDHNLLLSLSPAVQDLVLDCVWVCRIIEAAAQMLSQTISNPVVGHKDQPSLLRSKARDLDLGRSEPAKRVSDGLD